MSAIKTKCKADANYIPTEDEDLDEGQRNTRQTKKARKAEKKTPEGPFVKVKNEKESEELSTQALLHIPEHQYFLTQS